LYGKTALGGVGGSSKVEKRRENPYKDRVETSQCQSGLSYGSAHLDSAWGVRCSVLNVIAIGGLT